MLRRFCLPFLILLVSIAAAAAAPVTITVGGLQRTYLIAGPLNGGPKPLIVVLHGLSGNGMQAAQATHLAQVANQDGFVAVFPDGLAGEWNHYATGEVTPAATQRWQKVGDPVPDDVAFINAIIDRLVTNHRADPSRVYVVGFSNGGFMALKLICDDEQRFAAAVLISTGMPAPLGATCHPPKPMPVLIEKGTADDHIHYDGGPILDREFDSWPTDRLNAFFVALDKCAGAPSQSPVAGTKFPTQLSTWSSCGAGPIDFYKVTGGPHIVYQLPPIAPTIWTFLQSHTL